MSKIVLTDLANLQNETTAVNAINDNNATLEAAFDNTLSLDGTSPNEMLSSLDMNSNDIINLPAPTSNFSPVRVYDLNGLNTGGTITVNPLPSGGTTGQVLKKNSNTNYDTSWKTFAASDLSDGTTGTGQISLIPFNLSGTPAATYTFQGTDTYVGRATTDTLTNKTIDGANNTLIVPVGSLTGAITPANGGTGATTAAGARTALGVVGYRGVGDTNNTITNADRTIGLTTTLTATRTHTLPAAASVQPGDYIDVIDVSGAVSLAVPVVIARAGSNTINGVASVCMATPHGAVRFVSDGISKWTASWYDPDGSASARQVGARGDNITDDTAALNALINMPVGQVFIPGGIYRVTALVQTQGNQRVTGTGAGTRIIGTTATDDILTIGNNVVNINHVTWEHVSFWSTVTRTAGAVIRIYKGANIKIQDCNIGSSQDFAASGALLYDGVVVNQFAIVEFYRNMVWGGSRNGITVFGNAANSFGVGFFTDVYTFVANFGNYGIWVGGGTGGVNLDCNVQLCGSHGIYVDTSLAGTYNREVFFGPNLATDTNNGSGIYFDTNSTFLALAEGAWSSGNHGDGVTISATQISTSGGADFKFCGCNFYSNRGHGIHDIGGGSNLILTGSNIILNGSVAAGGGAAHGLWIDNKGAGISSIVANHIDGNGQGGTGFGVTISGTNSQFNISGNTLTNNSQGSANNASGFSDTQIMFGNLGFQTGTSNYLGRNRLTIASATTTDLSSPLYTSYLITGTTTITGLGSNSSDLGVPKMVVFNGALSLVHSGSLTLPGSANITTAAGDCAIFVQETAGAWRCYNYQRVATAP